MGTLLSGVKTRLVLLWLMALSPLMTLGVARVAAVLSYYYSVQGNVTYAGFCMVIAKILGGTMMALIMPVLYLLYSILVTYGVSAFVAIAATTVASLGPWAWAILGAFLGAI